MLAYIGGSDGSTVFPTFSSSFKSSGLRVSRVFVGFSQFQQAFPIPINNDKQKNNIRQVLQSLFPFLLGTSSLSQKQWQSYKNDAYLGNPIINNNNLGGGMQIEDSFDRRKTARKVRVKVKTNRNVDFITAIRQDATISDLANRALSVYLELSEDAALPAIKKQLTVSAVKQGIFFMPKSELVANLLNPDDEVEVVIIKAKPKYPNQIFNNQEFLSKNTTNTRNNPVFARAQPQKQLEEVLEEAPMSPPKQVHKEMKLTVPAVAQVLLSASKMSKRQKKKQKKKEKQQKRKKEDEPVNVQKSQKKANEQSEIKQFREGEFSLDSNPRKRLKFDKEESAEKAPQIVMPSPKITFHTQPKIDPPKVSLTNDSIKKKTILQGPLRKPSEDQQKKNPFEKVTSPLIPSKSPLIFQRTPNQQQPQQNLKQKDKEELSNFALSGRKLSDDQSIQIKKSKPKDDSNLPKDQQPRQAQGKAEEKVIISPRNEPQRKQQAKPQPVKIKPTHSLVVVQQDDSDSQQNKKTNEVSSVHHRQRELIEIQQQIKRYQLSQQDED